MSADLTQKNLDDAAGAVDQVVAECREEAERTKQAWIDEGQDVSLALVDIAADIVRRLDSLYDLGLLDGLEDRE